MKKTNLNKKQIRRLVCEELHRAHKQGLLEEGVWDSLKHTVAKTLGTWEKGGKIRGRGKRDAAARAQAEKSLEAIEAKAGAAAKNLIGKLREEFKETGFPNQKNHIEFVEQATEIIIFYDSIVKAHETDQMKMPAVLANPIIENLRIIVKRFLDYELWDYYKHALKEELQLEEGWEEEAAYQDVKSGEKEGPMAGDKDSTTIASHKSLKLPAILGILAGSSVLADIFIKSSVFKGMATKIISTPGSPGSKVPAIKKVFKTLGPDPGEGMTQMVARMTGQTIDENTTMDQFFKIAKQLGITPGNIEKVGVDLGADPGAYAAAAKQAGAARLGDVFGTNQTFWLDNGASSTTTVFKLFVKTIGKTAGKTIAKTTAIGKMGALAGPFLAPLGVALGLSALGVYALRKKGLKSSRAQVLNDILQQLDFVEDVTDQPPVEPEEKNALVKYRRGEMVPRDDEEEGGGDQGGDQGGDEEGGGDEEAEDAAMILRPTSALTTLTDPEASEEERTFALQTISKQDPKEIGTALVRAGVGEKEAQNIVQAVEEKDPERITQAAQEVKPELDKITGKAMRAEAKKYRLPTGREGKPPRDPKLREPGHAPLVQKLQKVGLDRKTSLKLDRWLNSQNLMASNPSALAEEADYTTTSTAEGVGRGIAKVIKKQEKDVFKRFIVRFVIHRTYNFESIGANTKEEKRNVVHTMKIILGSMSENPQVAAIMSTVLAVNPDNLQPKQVEALRSVVKKQQTASDGESEGLETTLAEIRAKANEDRFKRLVEGLIKRNK